ncbi:MAG: DUF3256 family protein [Prevotella sp.]|jgi:hypothetical protein|nr:DUF3256 family protein [Prevotella sp.]
MKYFYILFFSLTVLPANAQSKIAELFKEMPDEIMPTLTKNNRLDMIDFLEAKMKARVTNALDGQSEMTCLTNDSLSIRLDNALLTELFLVEAKEEYDSCRQVICMKSSYYLTTTGEREIQVAFYSLRWQPLDNPKIMRDIQPSSTILRQDERIATFKNS